MGFSLLIAERRFSLAVLVLLAFLAGNVGSASGQNVDVLRLKDVKVGMKGFGKTVVHGRKIETFEVEVLGILSNNKVNENLLINGKSILVKVSGDVIRRAGGIAAGMSGSPVYIDGKLMGGISSGWIMTDHTVGLVTPIEEMLEIWSYPDFASACVDESRIRRWVPVAPLKLDGKSINAIIEAPFDLASTLSSASDEAVFQQASVDVYVDGLDGKAAEVLKSRLQKKNLVLTRKGGAATPETPDVADASADSFEPGSAFGIQLARGDINMTTLGTVTHRSAHRILALAHPFLKKGAVSFLMTGAYIHHSFSSVQMPFKIGAPTEMLGIITQ
ncbi:MAG: SpoIVB peptidase S55 domain-containing protein, partial [Candidatus Riflebacteria bacterium]|nr:SpoIVB peptidase S55 domain-containing protein [Candidatus Riflebacteria bacterium]